MREETVSGGSLREHPGVCAVLRWRDSTVLGLILGTLGTREVNEFRYLCLGTTKNVLYLEPNRSSLEKCI
jgi:hypothetical protein